MEALVRKAAVFDGDLVRNIKGIRVSQDLFDDLCADAADRAVAIAAESATRTPSAAPLITRPFDYGAVITYPFVPDNWQATRYSDGLHYGVGYGALELETTVYETVYHWHRFVMASFAALERDIIGERRAFQVHCDAVPIDLRAMPEPRLTDRRDYSFTWQVGRFLWQRGQSGLLTRSARSSGRMNPLVDSVSVERAPGAVWLEIRPSTLA